MNPRLGTGCFRFFSSLEALGFAAAGLLLGRSVGLPGAQAIDALQRENAQLSVEANTMRHVTEEIESDLQAAQGILRDETVLAAKRTDAEAGGVARTDAHVDSPRSHRERNSAH